MSRHFYSQTHTHRSILTLKAFHTIKSLSNVLREERMNSSLVQSQQEIILVV